VPVENIIGEEGKGFQYQMIQFQEERLFAAASLLAAFENVLATTAEYVGASVHCVFHNCCQNGCIARVTTWWCLVD